MAPFLPLLFFLLLNDEVGSPVPQGFLRTSVNDILGWKGRESEMSVVLHGGLALSQALHKPGARVLPPRAPLSGVTHAEMC